MSIKNILILFAALGSTNAFAVSPSRSQGGIRANTFAMTERVTCEDPSTTALFSKTRLQYRNQDEDQFLYTDSAVIVSEISKQNIPQAIFLPRLGQDRKRAEQILDAEMILGRIAMAASIVMISAELFAGTSLPQQIVNVLY
jgi:hypothetical protein